MLVLGLSLLVPSSVSLILWTLAQLSRPAYVLWHRIFIGGLGTTLVLLASREVSSLPGSALAVGAVVISAGATGMYHRLPFVRLFLTFLTPALLVFPVVFLSFSPIAKLTVRGQIATLSPPPITATFPIVLVVFDEFPLAALMDENQQIDAVRYPHFAAFAQDATWFRNATTVSGETVLAPPSILTDRYPDHSRAPMDGSSTESVHALRRDL